MMFYSLMAFNNESNTNMEKYSNYSIEDFTTDSYFIKWVLKPEIESIKFWEEFKENNPSQLNNIEEAILLIRYLQAVESDIPQEKIEKIKTKIFVIKKGRKLFYRLGWAAIFIALIGVAGILYQLMNNEKVDFAAFDVPVENEAQIIFADGSKKSITSENSQIIQEKSGTIIVDSDTLTIGQQDTKSEQIDLVTVVMPYGKQTHLQLSDGSIIHINSGSKVSYPIKFVGAKREIYLCGEAYLEVNANKQKPFIVHTADIDIRVTGTEFNVSAYSDDSFTQTVLVSGVVAIDRKNLLKRNIELLPGESFSLNKLSGEISKEVVDTGQYTSWIQGYIICRKEPVSGVVKKLERYYNCKIICEESIAGITFSGKLDLKENINSVVEALSFASPMEIEINKPI